MSTVSRIIVAIASLALIVTYFVPFWFIYLIAPQYPEGLTMYIWLNKLTGQVEIINGLNHYIGMAKITEDQFRELDVLVYVVAIFILLGLTIALTGNRRLLFLYLVLTVIGGTVAMVDMYRWGYDYGHNLDPTAPIQVPGLSYQPPLIGHKKLLNFDAYSYPDTGGWIVIGVAAIFFVIWLLEFRKSRKIRHAKTSGFYRAAASVALFACALGGCKAEPEKIAFGKDLCEECKMTIMDPKFAGEVVTKKGKAFKFDDAHCLVQFLRSGKVKEVDVAQTVFLNYQNAEQFLDARTAQFVVSHQLKSPMNGNAAAFPDRTAAETKAGEIAGQVYDWNSLYRTMD